MISVINGVNSRWNKIAYIYAVVQNDKEPIWCMVSMFVRLDSGPPTANYHINGRHNDIQRWTFRHEGLFI